MASSSEPAISQEEIIRRYQTMTAECTKLVEKITELEVDRNEHRLVENTLEPLDGTRKAYRLVGGVLVERTVMEVLPSVRTNRENLDAVIDTLKQRLETMQKDAAEWKAKYDLKTPDEVEAIQKRQQMQAAAAQAAS
mmetsp:Transcript_26657/g.59229  ORF Transcript_26657/g.59229 Transcript_26657/m.59229 type:complete len:137 (+) Transcript_26657:157-567(+)